MFNLTGFLDILLWVHTTYLHCKLSELKSHIYVIGRWNTIFQVNDTIAERDWRLKTCAIVIKVRDYEYDSSYDYKTSWQKRLASTTAAGK